MTSVLDTPVASANPTKRLTPDQMLAIANALPVNPKFEVIDGDDAEIDDGKAARASFLIAWRSDDTDRELCVNRYDTVAPDGTIGRWEEIYCSWPYPCEIDSFRQGLAELYRLAYAAGRAAGREEAARRD